MGLRPSTRRGYRGHLDRHVLPHFGGVRVGTIDYAGVELFIADRLRAGLSPKMVRDSVSVLSLVLQLAMRSKAIRENPASGHAIRVRRRKIREGDVLDMAQLHRLVAQTRDPYKPALWVLALAGLRPAELCGLRVRDVDLVRAVLYVRGTVMPVQRFADDPFRQPAEPRPLPRAGHPTGPAGSRASRDAAHLRHPSLARVAPPRPRRQASFATASPPPSSALPAARRARPSLPPVALITRLSFPMLPLYS